MSASFELELHGGAIEKQYRRACPEVDQLPWGTLDLGAYTSEEIDAARLGWTTASRQEYESTAVHAATLQDMLRIRMPLDLTAMSTQFQREELTHAELAAKLAMELGGGVPIAAVAAPTVPLRGSTTYQLVERALWAFAISETYSHAMLTTAFTRARDPLLRGVRNILAKDEAAHGRFGWILLDWLLPEMSNDELALLRTVAKNAVDRLQKRTEVVARQPRSFFGEISALGHFAPDEYRELGRKVLETQVIARLGSLDLV